VNQVNRGELCSFLNTELYLYRTGKNQLFMQRSDKFQ